MSDFVVRMAGHSDVPELKRLMTEYIVDFYKMPRPLDDKLQALIGMLLFRQEGIQFVASQNGQLVGFATLYFSFSTTKADKITILNDLYVDERLRGTGVAQFLFEACHAYTKEHEYAYMSWVTASNNKRAQRFYDKMGGQTGDWIHYSV